MRNDYISHIAKSQRP